MMDLNNPLPLLSAKFFGVGIEIYYERDDLADTDSICITIELIAWKWCKEFRK